MQKMIVSFILFLLLNQSAIYSQVIDERVYVQTDRNHYAKGETVHFKAFIISGSSADIQSTNLFVELWDSLTVKAGSICLPVIDGTASGSIVVPALAKSNHVFLRAFTDISILQPAPYQFVKNITTAREAQTSRSGSPEAFTPVFVPEGGRLVYNADNHIAFRAQPGFTGTIQNSKGETIGQISAGTYGNGMFSFRPLSGEKYFCRYTANGKEETIALPVPAEEGIALHVYQSTDTLYFDLDNGGNLDLRIRKPKVQLLINGELAYVVALNMTSKNRFSYFIPLKDFQPVMAEFQVLDAEDNLLASRPVFIAKSSLLNPVSLELLQKNLGKRGESILKFDFHDSLLHHVSVSITDAALNEPTGNTGLAGTLLTPSLSFTEKKMSPAMIDLALLSSGLRLDQKAVTDTNLIQIPRHLQLQGMVKKGKKPLAGKELMVGLRSAYTGKELYKVQTDEQGRFLLEDMIFYDESFIHTRLPGNSEEELITDLTLQLPSFRESESFISDFKNRALALIPATATALPAEPEDTLVYAGKTIVLEEVIVKTDQNQLARKRLEDLEKKYIDGSVFSGYGASGETLDVINDPLADKFNDMFTYIASKMRSVSQRFVRGRKELVYFGRGVGGETMLTVFYLGNSKIDRDFVESIRLNEVAAIKFIPMLGSEMGFPPALAIFLKKPGDQGYWEKDRYQLMEQKFMGYTVPRDFVAPDYSKTDVTVEKDLRKTLLWQPYTRVDKGQAIVRFYNNDRAQKIRVLVEGVTEEGNIVFFEQVLE